MHASIWRQCPNSRQQTCLVPVCIPICIKIPLFHASDVLVIVLPAAESARLLPLALLTLQAHHTLRGSVLWQHINSPKEPLGLAS